MELNEEQKTKILEFWNNQKTPPSIVEILKYLWPNDNFDGRSMPAKIVKEFLATRQLITKSLARQPKEIIPLTEDQKTYIANNINKNTSLEIARILFNNNALTQLNSETRLISEYVGTLDTRIVFNKDAENEIPKSEYKPPVTFDHVFRRVNQSINFQLDKDKLTMQQKKELMQLINYLHTYRLIKQINNYENESDRKSFEDAFIRYTYDKSDLTQEEIDQYILLCHEVIVAFNTQKRIEGLQKMWTESSDAQENPEKLRLSMTLVEAIGVANKEYNECSRRQKDLLNDLKGKRSDRLNKEIKANASILNLVELWKNEESRREMLALAMKEQESMANEVNKQTSLSEIKGRILGLTKEEILLG